MLNIKEHIFEKEFVCTHLEGFKNMCIHLSTEEVQSLAPSPYFIILKPEKKNEDLSPKIQNKSLFLDKKL